MSNLVPSGNEEGRPKFWTRERVNQTAFEGLMLIVRLLQFVLQLASGG
ncbi:hypothetical protein [Streptomyces sp. NPDC058667]